MTISTTNTKKIYNGNASATVFAYDFLLLESGHLQVYVDSGAGLVLQTLTTHYTLSGVGNPSGGNVTFVTPPPTGTANVVILRVVPLTQVTDYIDNDSFAAGTHETALDKLVMMAQQLKEAIDRALLAPVNSSGSFNLPAAEASKLLGWSGDGTQLVNTSPAAVGAGSIGATELATGAVTAAKLAAAVAPGKQTIWVPAAAFIPRTTNGPGSGSVETTTNKVMLKTLDFDQTTEEFAQLAIRMPKSWDIATISASFVWTANSTSTSGVTWKLSAIALGDDETIDGSAFSTSQSVNDANTATAYQAHLTGETNALTVLSSPSQLCLVVLQISREVGNVNDTLAADALLIGAHIHYTVTGANDA